MKYMGQWKISPNNYKGAVERFLSTGAPEVEGMSILGRWHVPGSSYGWILVEGEPAALAAHAAQWGDLLELTFTPVFDDETAAAGLSQIYGS